jgi:uroporphyrinogen decarboxylase
MTPLEIITAAAALRATDRLPSALLAGGSWALNSQNVSVGEARELAPEKLAELLGDAFASVGSDIWWVSPGFGNIAVELLGGKLKYRSKGPPDVVEPLFTRVADMDGADLSRVKASSYAAFIGDVSRALLQKTGGVYAVGGSNWGPLTFAGLLFGAENLMRSIRRDKAQTHRLLDWTAELYLTCAQVYIDAGVNLVSMGEPTASGDMISRDHFAEFVLPPLKKIYGVLRSKNVIAGLHICGNIEDRLDLIAQTGAQFISLDYKVSLKAARAILDGRMAFAGNMNPVDVMLRETPDAVEAACRRCVEDAGPGPGFILMPGCDIPPATPAENIRAMTRVAASCVFPLA